MESVEEIADVPRYVLEAVGGISPYVRDVRFIGSNIGGPWHQVQRSMVREYLETGASGNWWELGKPFFAISGQTG